MRNRIVKVMACRTSDGKLFDNSNEALQHQKTIDLKAWYEDHPLYGIHKVGWSDFRDWLETNSGELVEFLADTHNKIIIDK